MDAIDAGTSPGDVIGSIHTPTFSPIGSSDCNHLCGHGSTITTRIGLSASVVSFHTVFMGDSRRGTVVIVTGDIHSHTPDESVIPIDFEPLLVIGIILPAEMNLITQGIAGNAVGGSSRWS